MQANLYIAAPGVTQATPCTITGSSTTDSGLVFFAQTQLTGTLTQIPIAATNALGNDIRKIQSTITWSMTIGNVVTSLGDTGPHVIYTTFGTPITTAPAQGSIPTPARMDLAAQTAQTALATISPAADKYTNYPRIVCAIVNNSGAYDLNHGSLDDAHAWQFPAKAPKDCIAISRYSRNVCMVLGITGAFDAKTYMAYYATAAVPNRPATAVEGSLRNPYIHPGNQGAPLAQGLNAGWAIGLADVNCVLPGHARGDNPGQPGCQGGLNAFEAAVVYTPAGAAAGFHWYFPAGCVDPGQEGPHFTSADSVVRIFQTLAWVDMTTGTVRQVDYTYTPDANVAF